MNKRSSDAAGSDAELEKIKEEILDQVKKELQRVKEEIIKAVTEELHKAQLRTEES